MIKPIQFNADQMAGKISEAKSRTLQAVRNFLDINCDGTVDKTEARDGISTTERFFYAKFQSDNFYKTDKILIGKEISFLLEQAINVNDGKKYMRQAIEISDDEIVDVDSKIDRIWDEPDVIAGGATAAPMDSSINDAKSGNSPLPVISEDDESSAPVAIESGSSKELNANNKAPKRKILVPYLKEINDGTYYKGILDEYQRLDQSNIPTAKKN